MNSTVKTALLWVVIIVLIFLLYTLFKGADGTPESIQFSEFLDRVEKSQVSAVVIQGNEIQGELRTTGGGARREFKVQLPPNYDELVPTLRAKSVAIEAKEPRDNSFFTCLLYTSPSPRDS